LLDLAPSKGTQQPHIAPRPDLKSHSKCNNRISFLSPSDLMPCLDPSNVLPPDRPRFSISSLNLTRSHNNIPVQTLFYNFCSIKPLSTFRRDRSPRRDGMLPSKGIEQSYIPPRPEFSRTSELSPSVLSPNMCQSADKRRGFINQLFPDDTRPTTLPFGSGPSTIQSGKAPYVSSAGGPADNTGRPLVPHEYQPCMDVLSKTANDNVW
jgi:hypothetical protein